MLIDKKFVNIGADEVCELKIILARLKICFWPVAAIKKLDSRRKKERKQVCRCCLWSKLDRSGDRRVIFIFFEINPSTVVFESLRSSLWPPSLDGRQQDLILSCNILSTLIKVSCYRGHRKKNTSSLLPCWRRKQRDKTALVRNRVCYHAMCSDKHNKVGRFTTLFCCQFARRSLKIQLLVKINLTTFYENARSIRRSSPIVSKIRERDSCD